MVVIARVPGIDEPVCMITVAGSTETRYYYHYDGLGSVIALSNVNKQVVERYSYDVFGEPSATSSIGNPYLFTGREYDNETGNYYYRARYYNPSIGRFLQPDPVGHADSMNLYSYVGNNPLNWIDPYGLQKEILVGRVMALRPCLPKPSRKNTNIINNGVDSFYWYLNGVGQPAIMGEGYLSRFRNSQAYGAMQQNITDFGKSIGESGKTSKTYNYGQDTVDLVTAERPYDLLYNETFGTLQEVRYTVDYTVYKDYVEYKAHFYLKDNYNFGGGNNIFWRYPFFMHHWGIPYDATGSFCVGGIIPR
jgi:RHS repeat-associated protein